MKHKTKYIFITGGVISSLGKGIAGASLGLLLKQRGYNVTMQKFDPYLNVDAGTMNPLQHGEVFVTEDGAETDLDLGHYERFLDVNMMKANNVTTGQIYREVIENERIGIYLGETVQVIPHITDEIKKRFKQLGETGEYDFIITEIGGTVGDLESLPFIEAMRQLIMEVGKKNALSIHVTLVPYIGAAGEVKTKPTQHGVRKLLELGIQPDILICRSAEYLHQSLKEKISLFCNVPVENVISAPDCQSIYQVPVVLHNQDLDSIVIKALNVPGKKIRLQAWSNRVRRITHPEKYVEIALVGKYTACPDSYKSITEALIHVGGELDAKVNVKFISSESIENYGLSLIEGVSGILIPGGFGDRGIEGMISVIEYARTNKIPFFGICLGMQLAVVEYARNVWGKKSANSSEFKKSRFNIIDIMESQKPGQALGGTMRLGSYWCKITPDSKAYQAYGTELISERHRHRYEVNNKFRGELSLAGMKFTGLSPDGDLAEIIELEDHPWFVGCQFHPELKSRVVKAHPLFREFIKASLIKQDTV